MNIILAITIIMVTAILGFTALMIAALYLDFKYPNNGFEN